MILIPATLGGVYYFYRNNLRTRVEASLEQIRRDGYPASLEEWNAWYPEPIGVDNAANTYAEAFSLFRDLPAEARTSVPIVGSAELPDATEPVPPEMKTAIAEHLAANAAAVDLLHEAAAIEHCRFPINLNQGASVPLRHLTHMRNGARLLSLESLLHLEEGRTERALESVLTQFALADSLAQEPVFISYLVRIACHSSAFASLERILSKAQLSDEQLAAAAGAISRIDVAGHLVRSMAGERCLGNACFDAPASALAMRKGIQGVPSFASRAYGAAGLTDTDRLRYLNIMRAQIAAYMLPPTERTARLQELEAQVKALPQTTFLARNLLSWLSGAHERDLHVRALREAALSALAVESWRASHGALPDALTDLVPAYLPRVPQDPFDGKPMRYKRLEPGYVVYSVGKDRVDNGGAREKKRAVRPSPADITMRILR